MYGICSRGSCKLVQLQGLNPWLLRVRIPPGVPKNFKDDKLQVDTKVQQDEEAIAIR